MPYGQACSACYKAKSRCIARPNSNICDRCVAIPAIDMDMDSDVDMNIGIAIMITMTMTNG